MESESTLPSQLQENVQMDETGHARTGLAQSLARGGDPPCAVLSAGQWKLHGTWPLAHLWPLPITSALL